MTFILDFREANRGGAVVPGHLMKGSEDDLRRASKVTFLVHGFNVSRRDGTEKLTRLAGLLPAAADGAVVAVLWPGDHFVRALSYPFEGRDADGSAAMLARYIGQVLRPGTEISFVTHSLGARLAMETVKRLRRRGYVFRQICLMAAAIDDFSLAEPRDYRAATREADRVVVLASRKDRVLRFTYPVADLLQAFLFFWRDTAGVALGFHGPRPARRAPIPPGVYREQIPKSRGSGHGDYLPEDQPNPNQRSAAQFADEVLQGRGAPRYQ